MHAGLQLTSMMITVEPLDLFYAAIWMDLECAHFKFAVA